MFRGLPSSSTSKLSVVKLGIGRFVFLSFTSASRNTTRVFILIVSSTSWALMGKEASAMMSRRTLFINLLLIDNRCFFCDRFAGTLRISQQESKVLFRNIYLDHGCVALSNRDDKHTEFSTRIAQENIVLVLGGG